MSVISLRVFREGTSSLSSGRLGSFSLRCGGGKGRRVGCLWTHESVCLLWSRHMLFWMRWFCPQGSLYLPVWGLFCFLWIANFQISASVLGQVPSGMKWRKESKDLTAAQAACKPFSFTSPPASRLPPLTNESRIFLPMRWCELC